jgi:hypothetical protein
MRWTANDDATNMLTSSAVRFRITQAEVSALSAEMIEVSFIFMNITIWGRRGMRIGCWWESQRDGGTRKTKT